MNPKTKKNLAILHLLKDTDGPLSATKIAARMTETGEEISERSVRLYLHKLEERGLVELHGKKGGAITETGLNELHSTQIQQRVGLLSAKIDQMTYRMDFDLPTCAGQVVVNASIIDRDLLLHNADDICRVFANGYAMGTRAGLLAAGEKLGGLSVPQGKVGFCTVCSITLNGVLLKHGIPTHSRFGGLLELRHHKAERFVEIIEYAGTSIDPLEIFIRAGMTDYLGAIKTGNGRIGASFREIPADSRDLVELLAQRLDKIGLGAFMKIGQGGQPVMSIPVSEGRAGAVVVGGLNPIAVVHEHGGNCLSSALSGLMEFNRLFHYEELPRRIAALPPAD